MKKAAILVDGEWFRRSLEIALKGQLPHGVTADVMYKNALLALGPDEELCCLRLADICLRLHQ